MWVPGRAVGNGVGWKMGLLILSPAVGPWNTLFQTAVPHTIQVGMGAHMRCPGLGLAPTSCLDMPYLASNLGAEELSLLPA